MKRTEADHLVFMRSPNRWPNFVLPLKNHKLKDKYGLPRLALLAESTKFITGYQIAYDTNLWHKGKVREWVEASPEILVREGWEVD